MRTSCYLLDDTSYVNVFLTRPNGQELRVPFVDGGTEVMIFEPAVNEKNRARITYRPTEALTDGVYKLRVTGTDATGNAAGKTDYSIRFEVINESSVHQCAQLSEPILNLYTLCVYPHRLGSTRCVHHTDHDGHRQGGSRDHGG